MGVTNSEQKKDSVESNTEISLVADKPPSPTTKNVTGQGSKVTPKSRKVQITKTFVTRARSAAKNLEIDMNDYGNKLASSTGLSTKRKLKSDDRAKNLKQTVDGELKTKASSVTNKVIHKKTVGASVARSIHIKRCEKPRKAAKNKIIKGHEVQKNVLENVESCQSDTPNKITTETSVKRMKRKMDSSPVRKQAKKIRKATETGVKNNTNKSKTNKLLNSLTKKISKKNIVKAGEVNTNSYEIDIDSVIAAINVRIKNSEKQELELSKAGTSIKNNQKNEITKLKTKPTAQIVPKVKSIAQKKSTANKNISGKGKLNLVEGIVKKRKYVRKVPIGAAKSGSIKKQKNVDGTLKNKPKVSIDIKKLTGNKATGKVNNTKQSPSDKEGKKKSVKITETKQTANKKKESSLKNKSLKSDYETNSKSAKGKGDISKKDEKHNPAASDSDSDHSSTLYSLLVKDIEEKNENNGSLYTLNISKAKSPNKKKKQETPVKKEKDDTKKTSPKKEGSNGCRKNSPMKGSQKTPRKMLLKDSMKPKQELVHTDYDSPPRKQSLPSETSPNGPMTAASASFIGSEAATPFKISPVAPSQSMSPCAFYQSDSSPKKLKPALASRMPTIPLMPASPVYSSSCTYEKLVKDLPSRLQANRHLKRRRSGSDSDEEGDIISRRLSVRQSESAYKYKEIMVRKCQGYTQLWFNSNTKIKNSLNSKVMHETSQALHNAKFDDSKLVLLSGHGSTFCSGIDLQFLLDDKKSGAKEMASSLREFVNTLIAFPKPIVAAVNGPALGLGVAILPLCDIVYASDKATFSMPYTKIAQTPEGCSSYTFPHVMGMAMANELLLGARKLTAIEACQVGLVSQVFWPTSMMQEVIPRVQNIAINSATALEASKILMRSHQRAKLEYTNETECHMLQERWASSDCQRAIKIYLDKELGL